MDSSYHRYEGESQSGPAGLQHSQTRTQQLHQPPQQHSFASPLLQQQNAGTHGSSSPAFGTRHYLVSSPFASPDQQQQQQQQQHSGAPLTPFSLSYSNTSSVTPIGARGWFAEFRQAVTAAVAALHQVKQSPLRQLLLVFLLLSAFCFMLLHTSRKPADALSSMTASEAHDGVCESDYRENTLKLAHEASAFSLLAGGWPQRKFEASDVVTTNNSLYFVCDSSFALMKTGFALEPLSPENALIGSPERDGTTESDWEALWLDEVTGVFYVVREAITHNPEEEDMEAPPATETGTEELQKQEQGKRGGSSKPFHAHIEEIKLHGNSYTLQTTCKTDFSFSAGNKGFEGVVGFRGTKGEVYLLGLCEGNFCEGGSKGRTRGNGRMVLMLKETEGKKCRWKTLKVLELPPEIDFADYSSVTTRGNLIAIASQEDSRMWLGSLNLKETKSNSTKTHPGVVLEEPDNLQVLPGGKVLHFPRDDDCNVVYCNIEGIAFINDRMIVAASDKVKRWQEHRCLQKDQSLHIFSLPSGVGN